MKDQTNNRLSANNQFNFYALDVIRDVYSLDIASNDLLRPTQEMRGGYHSTRCGYDLAIMVFI